MQLRRKTNKNKLNIYENPAIGNVLLCVRSFSDLINEIEHNGNKFIPIVELAKIAGYPYLKNVGCDIGTINPKGAFYASNIKKEINTINNFHAFVFSEDIKGFYYSGETKEPVKNQIQLFYKLSSWGFLE